MNWPGAWDLKISAMTQQSVDILARAEPEASPLAALRASEERLRLVFDSLPSPCAIYDSDRRFRVVNQAMLKMLRMRADQIIGRRDEELLPRQFTDVYLPHLLRTMETLQPTTAECAFHGTGGTVYYMTHYVPLLDEAGNLCEVLGMSYDVTRQRTAEEGLRNRDREIRSLTENVPDIIARFDRQGRFLYLNRPIAETAGITAEEFLGKTMVEVGMPEPLLSLWERTKSEAFDHGHTVENEFSHDGPDGVRYFESRVVPEFDAAGQVATVLTITRDITVQKRARSKLAETEERYRLVLEDQTETISRFKVDDTMIFVNDVYCRLFGTSREDLLGNNWHPQAVAEDLPTITEKLAQLSPENPVVVIENRVLTATQGVRWMQFVNRGVFDETGRLVETQSVGRDVTERRLAEAKLAESEERFRLAFESIPVGMIMLDVNMRIQRINPALVEMLGYSEAEVVGHSPYEFTHPDDIATGRELTNQLLRGEISYYTRDKRHLHRDGRIVWCRLTVALLRNDLEVPFRFIGIIENITERRTAEEELTRYREHLEELVRSRTRALEASQQTLRSAERLASLGTLAAGIAHEINNPVGTILLAAEMAQVAQNATDTQTLARCLEGIKDDALRCGRIVKNVLHFARQEPSDKRPHPLNDVVRQTYARLQKYAAERRVTLQMTLDKDVGEVLMNPIGIEQALENVMRNAIEAQSDNVVVTIETIAAAECFMVRITDNGPGIPAEVQKHIFDPFFTRRRATGGTGLGLSLVHGTIRDHQGQIRVDSAPGQGTTFTILLPRCLSSD